MWKQSLIEGMSLGVTGYHWVSAILFVKPVLPHAWAAQVARQPCAYLSLTQTALLMILPVPHVLSTDLFPHPQATCNHNRQTSQCVYGHNAA